MLFAKVRREVLLRLFDGLYRFGQHIYDPLTVVFFGREWHRWRQTSLPWVRSGRTLELGCGTGRLLPELAAVSHYVVGLDLVPSMLAAARSRATGPHVDLVRADGTLLPFRVEVFETVVATFPAGYVAKRDTLDEVARILAPGGRFIAVVSAEFSRVQWKRLYIHPIIRLAYGTGKSMNRWQNSLLEHPDLTGEWLDLKTREGVAFVWIANKRLSDE